MTAALPRKLLAGAAAVLALPALGAVAYAAAHAVSNNPAPQRVLPIDSRSRVDDTTSSTDTTGVRLRETEPGDDRGEDTVAPAPTNSTTSSTIHDANDDHGGTTNVSDDGPNHDAGDDHGGRTATTSVTVDDHSGSGSPNSGRGGSDDSGHGGSDDSGHHGGDG